MIQYKETDSVSALTGSILPDPKLLHEGRHAVIGQTDTQHVLLGRSRPTHQEGLQDNAGEVGGMDIKKGKTRVQWPCVYLLTPGGSLCRMCSAVAGLIDS